jgi:hypothetical protein
VPAFVTLLIAVLSRHPPVTVRLLHPRQKLKRVMTDGTPKMFPLSAIERPRCSKCQTWMMLARTSPAGEGRDERLFECPKCSHAETAIMEDPLRSKAVGWLGSELKPPT